LDAKLSFLVRVRRVAVGAFVCGALTGVGGVAFAGTAQSAYGYFTGGNTTYMNYAHVTTSTSYAWSDTVTQRNGGGTQVGWAGSRGRLYTGAGALSCEGSNVFSSTYGSPAVGDSCTRTAHGTWYGYGVSYGWNGSSYNAAFTFTTPSQTS
jgi:hypothetical protein